jgi:hypothetical protein
MTSVTLDHPQKFLRRSSRADLRINLTRATMMDIAPVAQGFSEGLTSYIAGCQLEAQPWASSFGEGASLGEGSLNP